MNEPYKQQDHQHFEIREHTVGRDPMVDVLTWYGSGNKVGISLYTENLSKLRDTINEYLGDTCDSGNQ